MTSTIGFTNSHQSQSCKSLLQPLSPASSRRSKVTLSNFPLSLQSPSTIQQTQPSQTSFTRNIKRSQPKQNKINPALKKSSSNTGINVISLQDQLQEEIKEERAVVKRSTTKLKSSRNVTIDLHGESNGIKRSSRQNSKSAHGTDKNQSTSLLKNSMSCKELPAWAANSVMQSKFNAKRSTRTGLSKNPSLTSMSLRMASMLGNNVEESIEINTKQKKQKVPTARDQKSIDFDFSIQSKSKKSEKKVYKSISKSSLDISSLKYMTHQVKQQSGTKQKVQIGGFQSPDTQKTKQGKTNLPINRPRTNIQINLPPCSKVLTHSINSGVPTGNAVATGGNGTPHIMIKEQTITQAFIESSLGMKAKDNSKKVKNQDSMLGGSRNCTTSMAKVRTLSKTFSENELGMKTKPKALIKDRTSPNCSVQIKSTSKRKKVKDEEALIDESLNLDKQAAHLLVKCIPLQKALKPGPMLRFAIEDLYQGQPFYEKPQPSQSQSLAQRLECSNQVSSNYVSPQATNQFGTMSSLQNTIRIAREEEVARKKQKELELTRLAQKNNLSLVHSRFVNEKIRTGHLNSKEVSETQQQDMSNTVEQEISETVREDSKTLCDDDYGCQDAVSLSFDESPLEIPKSNFETKQQFYNKNIPLSHYMSSKQKVSHIQLRLKQDENLRKKTLNQSDVDGIPSMSGTVGLENVDTSLGALLSNRKRMDFQPVHGTRKHMGN